MECSRGDGVGVAGRGSILAGHLPSTIFGLDDRCLRVRGCPDAAEAKRHSVA